MKTSCFTTMIAVFMLLFANGTQAQTTQTKLDQVELMKQFLGSWTAEMGKDTTVYCEAKLFGNGIEDYMEFITKGKGFLKIKGLFGYDNKIDKYIHLKVYDPPGHALNVFWFASENIFEGVQYQYISNPENAPLKWEVEFKPPDLMIMTTKVNNNVVSILTFTREKK